MQARKAAEEVRYTLNWQLSIDNKRAERAIKLLGIG